MNNVVNRSYNPSGKNLAIALSSVAGSLIIMFVIACVLLAIFDGRVEVEISGPVVIGPEWSEFRLTKPLKILRDRQYLEVHVSDTHEPYHSDAAANEEKSAMLFPDGSETTPEVHLVDQFGKEYALDSPGFPYKSPASGEPGGGMTFSRSFNNDIDSEFVNGVYPIVKIRSAKAIHVSSVRWICYNQK
jgi:hypothetical protein